MNYLSLLMVWVLLVGLVGCNNATALSQSSDALPFVLEAGATNPTIFGMDTLEFEQSVDLGANYWGSKKAECNLLYAFSLKRHSEKEQTI